jgi:hypothetical protein
MWFWSKNKNKKQKSEPAQKVEKEKANKPMSGNEIWTAINQIQKELDRLKLVIGRSDEYREDESTEKIVESALAEVRERHSSVQKNENERVIEGVFDGECMIGADGEKYEVPANYASKSKLVEGDILKLTINNLGAFIYKQIKPIERLRRVGILEQSPQNLQYYAVADGKKWKLLTASVTYFKGEPGDEVTFLIPADGASRSAAVENIIKCNVLMDV